MVSLSIWLGVRVGAARFLHYDITTFLVHALLFERGSLAEPTLKGTGVKLSPSR